MPGVRFIWGRSPSQPRAPVLPPNPSGEPDAPSRAQLEPRGSAQRSFTVPDDFKQAIEQIKLRVPIEELVRERVPGLRKSGRLWTACCPFHDESTPSFKVDPTRGTWHCFGACASGGDVISFLEKHDNLKFREALDLLASRAGVELPQSSAPRKQQGADDPLYAVLERAVEYYKKLLHSSEGVRALEYLRGRGLTATTIEAFGLGFSPAAGEVLVQKALAQQLSLDPMLATGLARRNEQGRAYDFFRGRLMIPIRDERGRTVGFGARRLDDADKQSPKYVNTTETEVFHKGRLVYALDQAQLEVRRCGHMVLVEGYTDVMAAHQAGLRNVVAVLGTALTEEHAALVRRSGAKRVTLCFDGDLAGKQATWRALTGLLTLDIEIDVVRLVFDNPVDNSSTNSAPTIKDPCDLLIHRGAQAFQEQLAQPVGWFDFLIRSIEALADRERLKAVDRVLELIARLAKPLQRDARLIELAERLGYSPSAVREQFQSLPARLQSRAQERRRVERGDSTPERTAPERRSALSQREQMLARAWGELIGAVLLDGSLVVALREFSDMGQQRCPDQHLALLGQELIAISLREGRLPDLDGIMASLCEHPSRGLIVPLIEVAGAAESPGALFDGARAHLERARADELRAARIAEISRLAEKSPTEHKERLGELHRDLSLEKFAPAHQVPGAPARS